MKVVANHKMNAVSSLTLAASAVDQALFGDLEFGVEQAFECMRFFHRTGTTGQVVTQCEILADLVDAATL